MTSSDQVHLFDIWLVYLYFTDRPKVGKVRPVLVIGTKDGIVAVAKITSKTPVPNTGDIPIIQWREAGLNVPSTVRCSQVFEIGLDELLRDNPVGVLQPLDIAQVTKALTALSFFQQPDTPEE